jgi:hypothetical protein
MFDLTTTPPEQPKVLLVSAARIREHIQRYVDDGERCAKSYEQAHAAGVSVKDLDWLDAAKEARQDIGIIRIMLESIPDQHQQMTVPGFRALWNEFRRWRSADEIIAKAKANEKPNPSALSKGELKHLGLVE